VIAFREAHFRIVEYSSLLTGRAERRGFFPFTRGKNCMFLVNNPRYVLEKM